jgi:hypothetical protein
LAAPPATGAGSDKPVDASADEKIIAAHDAMACIDATVRTLLVSARVLQTQQRAVVALWRVFHLLLSVTRHSHSSFPPRMKTRGLMPPTLNYCATCSKRALVCSWSCAV